MGNKMSVDREEFPIDNPEYNERRAVFDRQRAEMSPQEKARDSDERYERLSRSMVIYPGNGSGGRGGSRGNGQGSSRGSGRGSGRSCSRTRTGRRQSMPDVKEAPVVGADSMESVAAVLASQGEFINVQSFVTIEVDDDVRYRCDKGTDMWGFDFKSHHVVSSRSSAESFKSYDGPSRPPCKP